MPYDEQVSPESDPPLVEPPPPVARLSGILAHQPVARTIVRAPLKLADEDDPDVTVQTEETWLPGEPEEPRPPARVEPEPPVPVPVPVLVLADAEPAAEPYTEPDAEPAVAADVTPEAEPQRASVAAAPSPDVVPPQGDITPPGAPDDGSVERFCSLCDARVRVGADDDRCGFGHRLSPAHARRRWWQRRRSR